MDIDRKKFGERLKELMKDYNETTYSLAKVVNLSPPTISRYSRGEMVPKMTTIEIIANHFNVNPEWLTGESNSIFKNEILDEDTSLAAIPVYESIQYNRPIFSNIKTDKELNLSMDVISNWGAVISVKAPDDSMKPLFKKGDSLIIKLGNVEFPNKLTAVHVNKKDLEIRKVIREGNQLILQPANFEYDSEVVNLNKDNVQVLGEVVYSHSENDTLFEE